MFRSFITRLKRTPILYRIAIGNAVIIILGAILGTLLTSFLANISATLWHFILFASIGVVISLVLNFIIIQAALRPIRDLRLIVKRIQTKQAEVAQLSLIDTDPDIYHLTLALNSLISQLESSNQQLRLLSDRAITAQEEERKRIARSLHDDTGQSLSTLIINLERLEKHLPKDEGELLQRLQSLRQMAQESLECLRSMIYDLRPAILDDLGLLPAIRWYARTNLEQAGIQVELNFPAEAPDLPQALTTTLFRITQEALNNIIRHSQAKKASISLGFQDGIVTLQVEDNGLGFDPAQMSREAIQLQHWGLVGIRERIELVRGHLAIGSDSSSGTTLTVTVPYRQTEVNAHA